MGIFFKERRRAVAYYRHSAEDKQEHSVEIQQAHTQKLAKQHDVDILHEEADEGKTGLLADRPGFQSLLQNWIFNPTAPAFEFVFVFDVSRWGRFQNLNEPGHYEFLCNQNGKRVIYVDQGFPEEDQLLMFSLRTTVERFMAAQYSRQLSEKVWHGSVRVSREGYSAGGEAPYGLARLLLDENKKTVRVLKKGEHKMISNQRVIFSPLNDETTDTVRKIFSLFVKEEKFFSEIALALNVQGRKTARGRPWRISSVSHVLENENYIGMRVYNKTWGRLREKKRVNPRSAWILCPNAFPAVISSEVFLAAQKRLSFVMNSRRNSGVQIIRRIERMIMYEFIGLLQKQTTGQLNFRRQVPIIFCIRQTGGIGKRWFFQIPKCLEETDSVIAFGINPESRIPLEQTVESVFSIPVSDFAPYEVLSFSERDDSFQKYSITINQAKEKIIQKVSATASEAKDVIAAQFEESAPAP